MDITFNLDPGSFDADAVTRELERVARERTLAALEQAKAELGDDGAGIVITPADGPTGATSSARPT